MEESCALPSVGVRIIARASMDNVTFVKRFMYFSVFVNQHCAFKGGIYLPLLRTLALCEWVLQTEGVRDISETSEHQRDFCSDTQSQPKFFWWSLHLTGAYPLPSDSQLATASLRYDRLLPESPPSGLEGSSVGNIGESRDDSHR